MSANNPSPFQSQFDTTPSKPWYKQWWAWILALVVIGNIVFAFLSGDECNHKSSGLSHSGVETSHQE